MRRPAAGPRSSGSSSAPTGRSAGARRSPASRGPRVSLWCELCRAGGPEALEDRPSRPGRVWNRIPEGIRERIVDRAPDRPERSPRALAVRFDL